MPKKKLSDPDSPESPIQTTTLASPGATPEPPPPEFPTPEEGLVYIPLELVRRLQNGLSDLVASSGIGTLQTWEFLRARAKQPDPKVLTQSLEKLNERFGPPEPREGAPRRPGIRFNPQKGR